jgi:hypothetical protein
MHAGFGQIEAHVMKIDMVAEVTCVTRRPLYKGGLDG